MALRARVLGGLVVAAAIAACGPPSEMELPDELGGDWLVQQVAGASLGEDVEIYLRIDAQTGAMSGFTGCNTFTTVMTSFSGTLAVGAIQEAPGACPNAAAATDETRFLGVLSHVHRYLRRGKSLELLPQEQGEALLRLRVDDFGTLTQPQPTSSAE